METLEQCLSSYETSENCRGELSTRRSAGGTCDIVRCEAHWEERDDLEDRLRRDYPDSPNPPSWFDPANAGECWDDDY